jgi:hypothetical protein
MAIYEEKHDHYSDFPKNRQLNIRKLAKIVIIIGCLECFSRPVNLVVYLPTSVYHM